MNTTALIGSSIALGLAVGAAWDFAKKRINKKHSVSPPFCEEDFCVRRQKIKKLMKALGIPSAFKCKPK